MRVTALKTRILSHLCDCSTGTALLSSHQMEGLDAPHAGDTHGSAVGQAAKVVKWMKDACPDMLPMAPLLGDLMFTGFTESRYGT